MIALLGDLHCGHKSDDPWVEDLIYESLSWFAKDCKSKGIKTCIQAGDWFDVRKGATQRTLNFVRQRLVPLFQDTFDTTYVIVGNHDMHFKHLITPNSVRECLHSYDGFEIIEYPKAVSIDGVSIDLIPWMCKENQKQILDFIKVSVSDYCMGHWELNGYFFYKGLKSHGAEPDFLDRYKQVWSGHFHTISDGGNVQYIGTPYTLTLGDANDPRGYWIYDSGQISFVQNPVMYHRRLYFDADTWKYKASDITNVCSNKVVKLVIERSHSETNDVDLDNVLDVFERVCHEFSFEYIETVADKLDSTEDFEVKKTFDIIEEQINLIEETTEVKNRVAKIFAGLYTEAMNSE